MDTLDNPVIGKKMYAKGYRYRLDFHPDSGLASLYVKTIAHVCHLLRREFNTEMCRGGYVITRINADGVIVC